MQTYILGKIYGHFYKFQQKFIEFSQTKYKNPKLYQRWAIKGKESLRRDATTTISRTVKEKSKVLLMPSIICVLPDRILTISDVTPRHATSSSRVASTQLMSADDELLMQTVQSTQSDDTVDVTGTSTSQR